LLTFDAKLGIVVSKYDSLKQQKQRIGHASRLTPTFTKCTMCFRYNRVYDDRYIEILFAERNEKKKAQLT